MREDQKAMLEELQEKLFDAMIIEANPDHWPGGNNLPMDMTQEERGDRFWCKKNAAATMTLLTKSLSIDHFKEGARDPAKPDDGGDLDSELKRLEREAAQQVEGFNRRYGHLRSV